MQSRQCAEPGCAYQAIHGSFCFDCAHERQRTHEPLRYVVWDAEDLD
jgi:hypothetical protein